MLKAATTPLRLWAGMSFGLVVWELFGGSGMGAEWENPSWRPSGGESMKISRCGRSRFLRFPDERCALRTEFTTSSAINAMKTTDLPRLPLSFIIQPHSYSYRSFSFTPGYPRLIIGSEEKGGRWSKRKMTFWWKGKRGDDVPFRFPPMFLFGKCLIRLVTFGILWFLEKEQRIIKIVQITGAVGSGSVLLDPALTS